MAELAAFKPASRETEADVNRDTKSTQRRLDRTLYLLVKKPRTEHAWQMPQGGLEGSESLVEVRAVLGTVCTCSLAIRVGWHVHLHVWPN